jgi:hypothetical protein
VSEQITQLDTTFGVLPVLGASLPQGLSSASGISRRLLPPFPDLQNMALDQTPRFRNKGVYQEIPKTAFIKNSAIKHFGKAQQSHNSSREG